MLFYSAVKLAGVSVAVLCLSTTSFFTALLEPLVFRRRVRGYELLLCALVVLGVVLLLRVEVALRGSSKGLAMGIGSAFFSAAFGTWNGSLVGRERAERVTLYELAAAGVACGVCFLAFGGFVAPWNVTLAHWGLFAFLLWPHEERLTARFYVGGSVLIALVFVNGALKSRGR